MARSVHDDISNHGQVGAEAPKRQGNMLGEVAEVAADALAGVNPSKDMVQDRMI